MSIIFHVDVNSAFLSWTAVRMLSEGFPVDIRTIPSAIAAGDETSRHAIILAKSTPAKKFNIRTAETIYQAKKKCPELALFHPDFNTFHYHSDRMYNLLLEYSPIVERFSIDECFIDYTASEMALGEPLKIAHEINRRIREELGFTVNIGVSTNKLLAKMASDFEKPNKVHTLFPEEIKDKMWPLPIEDLFMVGRSSAQKLHTINISTIGDLANFRKEDIIALLKTQGSMIWEYANGIDPSPVSINDDVREKSIGNSITTGYDVTTAKDAYQVLLWLSEKTVERLRKAGYNASVITVNFKSSEFVSYSHQMKVSPAVKTVDEVYTYSKKLFDDGWKKEPLRLLGISLGGLNSASNEQISFLNYSSSGQLLVASGINSEKGITSGINGIDTEKSEALEEAIAKIRNKFGRDSIGRAGSTTADSISSRRNRK